MRILPALALLAILATAPAASAQVGVADASLTVTIAPVEEALAAGQLTVVPVRLEYTYSTAGLSTSPIVISLKILEAPPWLVAALSPSTVTIPNDHVPYPGPVQRTPPQQAMLTLTATRDAPAGEAGVLRLSATAHPHNNVRGVAAEESALVTTAWHPCSAPPAAPASSTGGDPDGDLSTATLGTSTPLSPGLLAGAGALGAVAGGAFGWRLRRR